MRKGRFLVSLVLLSFLGMSCLFEKDKRPSETIYRDKNFPGEKIKTTTYYTYYEYTTKKGTSVLKFNYGEEYDGDVFKKTLIGSLRVISGGDTLRHPLFEIEKIKK